jgi:hypothetical protein
MSIAGALRLHNAARANSSSLRITAAGDSEYEIVGILFARKDQGIYHSWKLFMILKINLMFLSS